MTSVVVVVVEVLLLLVGEPGGGMVSCGELGGPVGLGRRQRGSCCHSRIWTFRLGRLCGVDLVVEGIGGADSGLGSCAVRSERWHSHEKRCWLSCSCLIVGWVHRTWSVEKHTPPSPRPRFDAASRLPAVMPPQILEPEAGRGMVHPHVDVLLASPGLSEGCGRGAICSVLK